jgi:tRNA U34 2-thiouridine synthase MnmA/TrmU
MEDFFLMKKNSKALVLLSGGLDSILAAKILKNQGIKITALSFRSYFFNEKNAKKAAKNLKIPIKIIDFSRENLGIVKNPKHGYGRAMNPCIDCHILMLKKAKEILEKEKFHPAPEPSARYGASFVVTGEVLGQRPMSQNKNSLNLIEKESGLRGYLLRPLSAKLLEPTIPEKEGLIKREKLFDITGRSRKRQMALAKKWKIKWYPTPTGGCLLTDLGFGKRLKELLKIYP